MVAAGKVSRERAPRRRGCGVLVGEPSRRGRPPGGGRGRPRTRSPDDVSPAGVSVRSRVHEYGGGAATVAGGVLFYVDQADQRWYRAASRPATDRPVALTPPSPRRGSVRYADGRLTGSGAVADLGGGAVGAGRPPRTAWWRWPSTAPQSVVPLVDRARLRGRPPPLARRSLAGLGDLGPPGHALGQLRAVGGRPRRAAGTVAAGRARRVAGGPGCRSGQPRWCRDGALVFVDDRSGWWLPYRMAADRLGAGGRSERLVDRPVRVPRPRLGAAASRPWPSWPTDRWYAAGATAVATTWSDSRPPADQGPTVVARDHRPTVRVHRRGGRGRCTSATGGGRGGSERIVRAGLHPRPRPTGSSTVDHPGPSGCSVGAGATPASHRGCRWPSRPSWRRPPADRCPGCCSDRPIRPCPDPPAGRPPLVVFCHGGPTAAAEPGFDPVVQFFTSRGLAVAAVDYRGSSGYGRAYRRALDGRWGEADVDDCVPTAEALARAGWSTARRMAIRGTSAGGLTALAALIRSRRFAGAAAWYGVTDLEALVADTHDFESRYLDALVGPWPAAAAPYRARSPIHHPDRVVGRGAPAPGGGRSGRAARSGASGSPNSSTPTACRCRADGLRRRVARIPAGGRPSRPASPPSWPSTGPCSLRDPAPARRWPTLSERSAGATRWSEGSGGTLDRADRPPAEAHRSAAPSPPGGTA